MKQKGFANTLSSDAIFFFSRETLVVHLNNTPRAYHNANELREHVVSNSRPVHIRPLLSFLSSSQKHTTTTTRRRHDPYTATSPGRLWNPPTTSSTSCSFSLLEILQLCPDVHCPRMLSVAISKR